MVRRPLLLLPLPLLSEVPGGWSRGTVSDEGDCELLLLLLLPLPGPWLGGTGWSKPGSAGAVGCPVQDPHSKVPGSQALTTTVRTGRGECLEKQAGCRAVVEASDRGVLSLPGFDSSLHADWPTGRPEGRKSIFFPQDRRRFARTGVCKKGPDA